MIEFAQYGISPKIKELNDPKINEKIDWIKSQIPEGSSDLVIAFGGDGEVLQCFHAHPDKRILSIKIEDGESLGFYSAINLNEVDEAIINLIKNEKFHILSVPLLDCTVGNERYKVLNDIGIQRKPNGKAGRFIVDVGGDIFKASGDGVVISTPSGSSSYNFSSGGCIVSWDLIAYSVRMFNITRGLRSISIVVPGKTITKVESLHGSFVEMDGSGREIEPKTQVTAQISEFRAKIISFEYYGQLMRIKSMIKSRRLD